MIGAAYNFKLPDGVEDPKYMMSIAIPGFTNAVYGAASGFAFTAFFSIVVLFSGVASDNCSRRMLLGIAGILWSATSITTAFSKTVFEVVLSRMMLGFFEAFCGPPAYSLIADYFPPEIRTTAIAVYNLGIYVGNGLSSLIIVMIEGFGWRIAYLVTGLTGVVFGLLCLIFIVDPVRGRFEPRKPKVIEVEAIEEEGEGEGEDNELEQASVHSVLAPRPPNPCGAFLKKYLMGFAEMFSNRTCLFVVLGGCFRFWQGYTIAYFALEYFADFEQEKLFGVLNSLAVLIGGFASNFVAGQLSDRLESRFHKIKPWICVIMSLLGVVTNCLCYLITFNFFFSMTFQFLTYLLAEGWMSPALAMI